MHGQTLNKKMDTPDIYVSLHLNNKVSWYMRIHVHVFQFTNI
jgi:hypothetical protein